MMTSRAVNRPVPISDLASRAIPKSEHLGDFGALAFDEHDVLGLEIAMDDAEPVPRPRGGANLRQDRKRPRSNRRGASLAMT
jgi:hypothetical protein